MSLRPIQQAALLGEIKGVAVLPRQVRNIGILYGPLAQVEEHATFNRGVPSSNLGWVTISLRNSS